MYPYPLFWNVDLYTLLLCAGILGAIVTFRIFAEKKKIYWRVQNLVIWSAAAAVVVGYFSAVVFQALYNIEERGGFVIDATTGATFYGGLIGGAACFIAVYFGLGALTVKNGAHKRHFFDVADIAAASIALAHGLGRIGCLMAGCCHGGVTDAWYGIYMPSMGAKVVPIQLYEALFLFLLFGFLCVRLLSGQSCGLPIYMAVYGVWRFVIEFYRRDSRGSTVVDFLSPSQFIAVLMIIGAIGLYFGQRAIMKRLQKAEIVADTAEVENER